MKNMLAWAALVAVAAPAALPTEAMAKPHHRHYKERTYQGRDYNYRQRCRGGNGAVGTVAGGVGGALLGNALGGGTVGTIAGGVGGGLLGRHLDKKNTRHRNGC